MSFWNKLVSQIPIVGGFLDNSQDQGMDQLAKNQQLYDGIQLPNFDRYDPVSYTPEMADATTVSEDPALRSQQMGVLLKMAGLAEHGLSDVDNAGYERAREQAGQIASSGNAAALSNAEARGIGGSGLEFAMREKANQDASQAAQNSGLQQAADSARMRAMYEQAYGGQLASVRGQDFGANKTNADILNNFNMYNTKNANDAAKYYADQQGYAQTYGNDMKQRAYQDAMSKAAGQSGANTGMAYGYGAQDAANTANRNVNTAVGFQAVTGQPLGTQKKKTDDSSDGGML